MKNSPKELIPLETVRAEMLMPTSNMPLVERSVLYYIEELGIEVHLVAIGGAGRKRRHVSRADAIRIKEHFRFIHRHKFKAADKGVSK